jgi:hypothetical protein
VSTEVPHTLFNQTPEIRNPPPPDSKGNTESPAWQAPEV